MLSVFSVNHVNWQETNEKDESTEENFISERRNGKMKKTLLIVVACLMMLSVVVIPVSAQNPWTEFEGRATPVGSLPGGDSWFSKDGTKWFIRDFQESWIVNMDDIRLAGNLTLTYSGNFHFTDLPVYIYGPFMGSVHIENADGYWEGRISGERTEVGSNYLFSVMHGHGDYEGMLAHVYFVRETPDFAAPMEMHGVVK